MDAGDYVNAKDLFLKSEYSDYSDKANECLCLLAKQYIAQENYSKAIEIYGQVDAAYRDVSKILTMPVSNGQNAWKKIMTIKMQLKCTCR